jgi:hypothetical protein
MVQRALALRAANINLEINGKQATNDDIILPVIISTYKLDGGCKVYVA